MKRESASGPVWGAGAGGRPHPWSPWDGLRKDKEGEAGMERKARMEGRQWHGKHPGSARLTRTNPLIDSLPAQP